MKHSVNCLNIGDLIKQKLRESDHTVVWFAKELGCSRTNAYKIFEKESINTNELMRISEILNYDFFKHYSAELKKQNSQTRP